MAGLYFARNLARVLVLGNNP